MEKSSLNIKSFRNLLSSQNKNYKITPGNSYHPTEVKLNGINTTTTNLDDEDIFSSSKKAESSLSTGDCDRGARRLTDVCGSLIKLVGNYNSTFCLTVLTPVACR